jgi:molybdenum cofactor cytidylyltransferase
MTGIIILAAGSSSRLGKPKQNLIYRGQTLLQRAIETANASISQPVMVVLGANADVIEPTIVNCQVNIIYNPDWAEGIASSIRLGITEIQKIEPNIASIILMLSDQPFLDTHILNFLVLSKSKTGIVACSYNDIVGPPALFDAIYFPELLSLKGNEGAKKLLVEYADTISTIPFPRGSVDIDTVEDYEKLSPTNLPRLGRL